MCFRPYTAKIIGIKMASKDYKWLDDVFSGHAITRIDLDELVIETTDKAYPPLRQAIIQHIQRIEREAIEEGMNRQKKADALLFKLANQDD